MTILAGAGNSIFEATRGGSNKKLKSDIAKISSELKLSKKTAEIRRKDALKYAEYTREMNQKFGYEELKHFMSKDKAIVAELYHLLRIFWIKSMFQLPLMYSV